MLRFQILHWEIFFLVSNTLNVSRSKLKVFWKGPFRIISVDSEYIFTVEDLLSKQNFKCHSSRLRFYSDSMLNVSDELLKQIAHDGAGYEIEDVLDVRYDGKKNAWELLISWLGFDDIENSWEPLSDLLKDCPVFIKRQLKALPCCPADLIHSLSNIAEDLPS